MTTPIEYADLTTVMSSTANGVVVPSAYGDQVRDNLMAIGTGWSFTATRPVSLSVPNGSWTQVAMTTFDTPYETGLTGTSVDTILSLFSGYMKLTRPGMWLFSAGAILIGSHLFASSISVGTNTGFRNDASDIHQEGVAGTLAAPFKVVTVPTYVGLWVFANAATTLSASVVPKLEGTWIGDA